MSSNHNEGKNPKIGIQQIVDENSQVLTDMIDFYKLINYQGTVFFNGMAGNSQKHFHFHHIPED